MNGTSGTATTTARGFPPWMTSDVEGFRYPQTLLRLSKNLYLKHKFGNSYTGTTYAGQHSNEAQGITMLATRGRDGDSSINTAKTRVQNILDGNYLGGTRQGFLDMLNDATSKPTNTFANDINSELGAKLYYVGDPSSDNLPQGLVSTTEIDDWFSAFLYKDNYDRERNIQDHAIGNAVEFGRQSVVNAETLRMAGLYQREYNQGKLEDAYKKWYDEEVSQIKYMEVLGNAIRALIGSEVSTTRPYYRPSPMVSVMGGAMAGAGAGAFAGPVGMGIGGVAGAVLGFLSN